MRNGTRCKRGALIGRFAREELWTRFINGAVKPMDAEVICNLTRSIRDQGRVEEIQRRCCMLLDEIREAFRAENPDAGVSAGERVFREYVENADALRDRRMVSEDYLVRAGRHEVLLNGRRVDLRKVRAVDKEGGRLSQEAYLTTPWLRG